MTSKGKHYLNMHKDAPPSSFAKARALRKNMTNAEKKLWESLRKNQFHGYKFRRQHPIHLYIVDFYCHELCLVIEIDGKYHNLNEQIILDKNKEDLLRFQDLHILRFTNDEVLFSVNKVLERITNYITTIIPDHLHPPP